MEREHHAGKVIKIPNMEQNRQDGEIIKTDIIISKLLFLSNKLKTTRCFV